MNQKNEKDNVNILVAIVLGITFLAYSSIDYVWAQCPTVTVTCNGIDNSTQQDCDNDTFTAFICPGGIDNCTSNNCGDCDDNDNTTNAITVTVTCNGIDNSTQQDCDNDTFTAFICPGGIDNCTSNNCGDCDDSDNSITAITVTVTCNDTDNSTQQDCDHDSFTAFICPGGIDNCTSNNCGDCDDEETAANPGADEDCNDNIDNDCDARVDCNDSDCSDASNCVDECLDICDEQFDDCRDECEDDLADCEDDCEGEDDEDECLNSCDEQFNDCEDDCEYDFDDCEYDCEEDCLAGCDEQFDECKDECEDDLADCEDDCEGEDDEDECLDSCDEQFDDCEYDCEEDFDDCEYDCDGGGDDDDDDDDDTTSSSSSTTSTTSTTTTIPKTSTTTSVVQDPQLTVSPPQLDFKDNETAKTLTISNTGTGILNWNINDNATEYHEGADWIFLVTPKSGFVEAIADNVTVMANRGGLSPGNYSADLPIISNAGNLDVEVTMEVEQRELPVLNIRPQVLLYLNENDFKKTFWIKNNLLRTGALTWEIESPVYHRGEERDWITIHPSSGYTTTETDAIQVTVNRDGLMPGLYSATIPVRSNAGNKNLVVVMLVQEVSELNVDPLILFYLNKDEVKKTFTITNSKSGILTWKVGVPVFTHKEGWITSIIPISGETTTEEDEVSVTVSREGLGSGIYRAKIPVSSNDDTKNVNVFLVVPFF